MRAITITVPDDLYERLETRAANAQRSVEAETRALLATAAHPAEAALPADLLANIAALDHLDDAVLWQVADNSRLTEMENDELAALCYQQQERGLTPDQRERLTALLALSDRLMLMRAEALVLLKQRGVDVAPLLVAR